MQKLAVEVSHSPLRRNPNKTALKNVLDNPLKSKWPVLSQTAILQIKEQLESSLSGFAVPKSKGRGRKASSTRGKITGQAKGRCLGKEEKQVKGATGCVKQSPPPKGRDSPLDKSEQELTKRCDNLPPLKGSESLSTKKRCLEAEEGEPTERSPLAKRPCWEMDPDEPTDRSQASPPLKRPRPEIEEGEQTKTQRLEMDPGREDKPTETSPPLKRSQNVTGRWRPLPPTERVVTEAAGVVPETAGHQSAHSLSPETVTPGEEGPGPKNSANNAHSGGSARDSTVGLKRAQLVVGLNAVTRLLEHGDLQVGLLCTSSPKLLSQHLMVLAATRKVPFASVPDLSKVVAKLLGIKRAMCIGLRRTSDSPDTFQELIRVITTCAPVVTMPWLARSPVSSTRGSSGTLEGRCVPPGSTPSSEGKGCVLPGPTSESMGPKPADMAGGKGHGLIASGPMEGKGRGKAGVMYSPMDKGCGKAYSPMDGKGRGKAGVTYSPLHIKRTKWLPNSKKKRKKK